MQAASPHLTRAAKYVLVGGANTVIYTGLLYFFLDRLAWGAAASVTSAYVLAMIFQYTANRYFTFGARGNAPRQFVRYLVSAFASYLLSLAIVEVCLGYLQVSTEVTVVICMIATAALGYVLGYSWIYR
jgi:putative flippase GtrA